MKRLALILFLFNALLVSGDELDSLLRVYNSGAGDTNVVNAGVRLCSKQDVYDELSKDSALTYGLFALELAHEIDYERGVMTANSAIGKVFWVWGEYEQSIHYQMASMDIARKLNDTEIIAENHHALGNIYMRLGDYEKALSYFEEALIGWESLGNKSRMATTLGNFGTLYRKMGRFEDAIYHLQLALQIFKQQDRQNEVARTMMNLANVYGELEEYEKALEYYQIYLESTDNEENIVNRAACLSNIGSVYEKMKDFRKAVEYFEKSLLISDSIGYLELVAHTAQSMANSYDSLGDYQHSLEYLRYYLHIQDSLDSKAQMDIIAELETRYQTELQEERNKELQASLDLETAAKEKQQVLLYFSIAGVCLLLGFGLFLYKRNKERKSANDLLKRQNNEISRQKEVIEVKNTEILDSISYAKRIQQAILPPTRLVKEWLPDSFVLYRPKDIVAGDFYWMESFAKASDPEGVVLFAAADCTGHGVPGAMVSVVCHNAMNRAVREFGLSEPGAILDKTRELVIEQFEKSDEDVKDGMDIALCAIESRIKNQESRHVLRYAGAHNPLWIMRKGDLEEIKATKQPIGVVDKPEPYQTHEIELEPGDTIYIFSDGYVDQFGGVNGKKFKASKFRELLLSVGSEGLDRQRELIDQAFDDWKGDLEQVDDVCVIGVRV